MTDRIAEPWGIRTPFAAAATWPTRVDEYLAGDLAGEDIDTWVQSACVLCSNGCALDIAVKDGRIVGVRGRAVDRVNHGRLGPKGLFGWQANNAPDRLTRPLIRQGECWSSLTGTPQWTLVVARTQPPACRQGTIVASASTPPASCSWRSTTRSA